MTTKREFSLVLWGDEIYQADRDMTDFVGVSILVNLEDIYDSDVEEGHGLHTISHRETNVTSAFVYVVSDNLDVLLVQKVDDCQALLEAVKNYI